MTSDLKITPSLSSQFNINLAGSYDSEASKKVSKVLSKHWISIVALATLTLPVFFIAWPVAAGVIYQWAQLEVDSSLAGQKIQFLRALSEKMSSDENAGKSQKDLLEECKNKNPEYYRYFKDVSDSALINLALIFHHQKGENLSDYGLWKTIAKTNQTVKQELNKVNRFAQVMGDNKVELSEDNYNNVLNKRLQNPENYSAWKGYTGDSDQTNREVLRKILSHKITFEELDIVTNLLVDPDQPLESNARIEAVGKARREILESLDSIANSTSKRALIDSLQSNPKKLQLVQVLIGIKLLKSHKENIIDLTEALRKNLDPSSKISEDVRTKVWTTTNGVEFSLIERMLLEWSRTAPPIIIGSPTSKELTNAETNADNCISVAGQYKQLSSSPSDDQNKEAADALYAYWNPLKILIDEIAKEQRMSVKEKATLSTICQSLSTQIISQAFLGTHNKILSDNPENKFGVPYSTKKSNAPSYFSVQQNTDITNPVFFSYNPFQRELIFETQFAEHLSETDCLQATPLGLVKSIRISVDLDSLTVKCEKCDISLSCVKDKPPGPPAVITDYRTNQR